jgi:hypothetical protein
MDGQGSQVGWDATLNISQVILLATLLLMLLSRLVDTLSISQHVKYVRYWCAAAAAARFVSSKIFAQTNYNTLPQTTTG